MLISVMPTPHVLAPTMCLYVLTYEQDSWLECHGRVSWPSVMAECHGRVVRMWV